MAEKALPRKAVTITLPEDKHELYRTICAILNIQMSDDIEAHIDEFNAEHKAEAQAVLAKMAGKT